MNKAVLLAAAAVACAMGSGYAWAQDNAGAADAKAPGARVRFFGQAAIGIKFFKNQTCFSGGGIQASKKNFGGMFAKNVSIGMPNTPTVDNMKSRDGILFAATYHEFAVRANEPLTIHVDYSETTGGSPFYENDSGTSFSCKQFGGTFKPEPGQDYDITVDISRTSCALKVHQIEMKGREVQLRPVPVAAANKCTADDILPINVCKATFEACKSDVTAKFKEANPEGKPGRSEFAECTAKYKACVAETQ